MRTAQRLKAAVKGFTAGASDDDISRTTGWQVKRVALIRGWWKGRRRATEQGGADVELGPHRRRLYYFGERLRDRIAVPDPLGVVKDLPRFPPLWHGVSVPDIPVPLSHEEASVESDWGYGAVDATMLLLYRPFKSHLEGNLCWQQLQDLLDAYPSYRAACRKLYQGLMEQYAGPGTGAKEESRVMASALLEEVWHQVSTGKPLIILADPCKVVFPVIDGTTPSLPWEARLGPYPIRKATKADAQEVAKQFQRISQEAARLKLSKTLLKAYGKLSGKAKAFREALSPNDMLHKLLLQGRCDLCP